MPAVVRLNDMCTGHGCWPPRKNVTGSPDVFVNSRPVHRVGDQWLTHCCTSCHAGVQSTGSPNVFANGRAVARVGDRISCGSGNATGSHNTFAN